MSKEIDRKLKVLRTLLVAPLFFLTAFQLFAAESSGKPIALFLNDPAYDSALSPIERSLAEQGIVYRIFKIFKDELPGDERDYAGIIIAGGDSMRNYIDWNNKIYEGGEIILRGEVPILGICLGHQIVSRVYGSVMYYSEERRWHNVKTLLDDPILEGLSDTLLVWENHAYAVAKLPDGFRLMASGSVSPIQMIKHETKTIYGVQFHPETPGEFLSTPQGWKLLSNFAKISKAETVPVPLPPNGRKVFPY